MRSGHPGHECAVSLGSGILGQSLLRFPPHFVGRAVLDRQGFFQGRGSQKVHNDRGASLPRQRAHTAGTKGLEGKHNRYL